MDGIPRRCWPLPSASPDARAYRFRSPRRTDFRRPQTAHESDWQERVIAHLGLDDWLKPEFTESSTVFGPSRRVYSAVTAFSGLSMLISTCHSSRPPRAVRSLPASAGRDSESLELGARASGPLRPGEAHARDVLRVGFLSRSSAYSPGRPAQTHAGGVHVATVARSPGDLPRVGGARSVGALRLGSPIQMAAALPLPPRRPVEPGAPCSGRLVRMVHPFTDAGFSAALARLPKPRRYYDRTAAMRFLFSNVLPDDVLARTTKSGFDEAFWSDWSRACAADWNGAGADATLVDIEALKQEWSSPEPDPRSFTLLQAAWLAANATKSKAQSSRMTSTPAAATELPFA